MPSEYYSEVFGGETSKPAISAVSTKPMKFSD